MAKSKNQIIEEIKEHIKSRGGEYSSWYFGVTEDPEYRLFTAHKVNKENDKWIYRVTETVDIARDIEKYFIEELKTDGDTGGGDDDAKYVYAYKKSENSEP